MEFGTNPTVLRSAVAAAGVLTLMAVLNSRHNPNAEPKPPKQFAVDCVQHPGFPLSFLLLGSGEAEFGLGNADSTADKWREHAEITADGEGKFDVTVDGFSSNTITYQVDPAKRQDWSLTSPTGSELSITPPPSGPGDPVATGPGVQVTFKCGPQPPA